jgi:hypothetical protein
VNDAGVAEVFEFGVNGGERAVYPCFVGHFVWGGCGTGVVNCEMLNSVDVPVVTSIYMNEKVEVASRIGFSGDHR